MKTNLKYILFVVVLLVSLSASAKETPDFPNTSMRSTSTLRGSGSTLPSAAANGPRMATMPSSSMGESTLFSGAPSRPRRVGADDGWEEEDGPQNPADPFPVGATPWVLMLLLCGGYAAFVAARRRGA